MIVRATRHISRIFTYTKKTKKKKKRSFREPCDKWSKINIKKITKAVCIRNSNML